MVSAAKVGGANSSTTNSTNSSTKFKIKIKALKGVFIPVSLPNQREIDTSGVFLFGLDLFHTSHNKLKSKKHLLMGM